MKLILSVLVFIFTISILAQNQTKGKNHFQTFGHVMKTSFNTIPSDFVHLGKEFSDDWKKTGYYAAGILGLIATDKITTKAYQKIFEPNIRFTLPNITPNIGIINKSSNLWIKGENAYLTYPIIGLYFGSLFTNSEKGQFVGVNSFKAIAYTTLINQVTLKTIFGRNRPHPRPESTLRDNPNFDISNYTTNNWDFFNSRNGRYVKGGPWGSALPSTHVTTYFALAKVIQMEYDNYWIPYSIMSVVFLNEIDGHQHWFSDMVVGGILGTLIGRSVVRSSWKARGILPKNKQRSITLNYIPQVSPDFTGLRIIANIE